MPAQSQHAPALSTARVDRRQLLRAGGLGFLGVHLAHLFEAEARAGMTGGAALAKNPLKSCILMFYYGGPSHHDTWDMKPLAPAEVRGEFKSIATSVPGVRISEHLPRSAQIVDRLAVVRGMHHTMSNHNAAAVEALCGRTPLKGDLELLSNDPTTDFPCYGSALTYLKGPTPSVPPHVALPHVMYNVVKLPGQTAGFLGAAYEPLQVTKDPNAPDFRVAEIELPSGLSLGESENRRALLSRINARMPDDRAQGNMNAFYRRAFDLLRSDAVRRAFDIGRENARTRERYGRNIHGQSALLARRLVESGVRFVSVFDRVRNGPNNWDTHDNNFGRLKDDLLPPCDTAFSALIEDLEAKGLLDSTLVVMLGEFGRTPKINGAGGRDHWPNCFSVVLAGGGIAGGTMYGASDKLGAYPETDPVTPGDLAATIFWRFGLDPATELHDPAGRPFRLAAGAPIHGLF